MAEFNTRPDVPAELNIESPELPPHGKAGTRRYLKMIVVLLVGFEFLQGVSITLLIHCCLV